MRVVVKLTGYLFDVRSEQVREELEDICDIVRELRRRRGLLFHLVAGGGPLAREYIEVGRRLGANEGILDQIGISFTRTNARLLHALLHGIAYPSLIKTLGQLQRASLHDYVTVGGGLYPGISTNAVSALTAELVHADILITLSRSGGVFDKDPSAKADASLLPEIAIGEIERLLEDRKERAGEYPLMDGLSLSIIHRSRIPTVVTSPTAEAFAAALRGDSTGTRIRVDE
jgi:uridylate kinase